MNANDTLFALVTLLNSTNNRVRYDVCLHAPPYTVSDGIWGGHYAEKSPLRSPFPVFLLQVILIYTVTRALRFPVKKLGLPMIISQMMAGLILGPSLNILEEEKRNFFPYGSQDTLATITSLGYVLFVFENGVKMDFSMINKTGKKGWVIGVLVLMSPLLIGLSTRNFFSTLTHDFMGNDHASIIITITQNIISFAVVASTLNDLQIINSELGRLTLSCALIGDILSNTLVIVVSSLDKYQDIKGLAINLGSIFAITIIIVYVYRPLTFWVIEHTPERQEVKDVYINIILGVLFVLGWLSVLLKQELIFLPLIFGLATPDGPPLGSALVKRIHVFGTKFLLPIFMTTCAMKVNLSMLHFSSPAIITAIFFVFLGHATKMAVCILCSLYFKLPLNDALSLGFLLNCKGVVEVSMYSSALDKNDLDSEIYSMIILITMITSIIVHLMVKRLYDSSRKYAGYEQRNIFSLKPNTELRILVCIHKQYHTIPIIRILDIFNPTTEELVIVDALHLIELVGRSSPVFISHKMKKGITSIMLNSYSENVILSFKLYEDENQGMISINPYTAISPPKLMHEDVCNLAMNKAASIIILPFHRRWSIDGKIEHEDKNIRSLNCKVMERAPCSVGILVSRFVHQGDSPLRLAMIFLGGNDDREALCLAKRAAKNSNIILVVYHITTKKSNDIPDLDTVLDITILNDSKLEHSKLKNVSHREITVEGGSETASILCQLVDEHDYFIVGRRHGIDCIQTKGLQQWSEFPELGLIGDYLASPDLDCKSSILVVQQQQLSL